MPTATLSPTDPQTIAKQAIKNVSALATLPEVTSRIMATVEDPRSSASTLHRIIAHDPALVTRILKLVNSSFYGLPSQINNIDRAIVLLGLNAVKNVAIAASLGQMFRGSRMCERFTARDLWKHCIAVAVAARALAKAVQPSMSDEAFLAGMIHDVGIVVELQAWPEKLRDVCNTIDKQGGDFRALELQIMNVDHQTVGHALAEEWKFPLSCRQAALYHHNPAALEGEGRKLVIFIHVADTLCCKTDQGFNLTAIQQELDSSLLAEAGIDPALIAQITTSLPDLLNEAAMVLS